MIVYNLSHILSFTVIAWRVYSTDNIEYDAALKRMRGYPHGTPTFLHPEVEGL